MRCFVSMFSPPNLSLSNWQEICSPWLLSLRAKVDPVGRCANAFARESLLWSGPEKVKVEKKVKVVPTHSLRTESREDSLLWSRTEKVKFKVELRKWNSNCSMNCRIQTYYLTPCFNREATLHSTVTFWWTDTIKRESESRIKKMYDKCEIESSSSVFFSEDVNFLVV